MRSFLPSRYHSVVGLYVLVGGELWLTMESSLLRRCYAERECSCDGAEGMRWVETVLRKAVKKLSWAEIGQFDPLGWRGVLMEWLSGFYDGVEGMRWVKYTVGAEVQRLCWEEVGQCRPLELGGAWLECLASLLRIANV
ncbi:hypothetical protein EPH_0006490 [Eimeria praecox]|uniref:Uncharacterized protein n=1 Tax=Eimeria praecox TaxID=51316 RepID=U6G6R7_9EIME|nr:hypothetical protein EPH_0006490 [Eimeria praecox]